MSKASNRLRRRILLDCGTNEVEFLRFELCNVTYGINVAKIQHIAVFDPSLVTPIALSKRCYSGNILHRGSCVPIISLRAYLEQPDFNLPGPELILYCEFNNVMVGFRVDRVVDILRCSWDNFSGAPSSPSDGTRNSISGTVIWQGEMTPILDVEEILVSVRPDAAILRDLPVIENQSQSEPSSKNILYCEDSPTVQRVLVQALRKMGYANIQVFNTGSDGLKFLREHPESTIDLIISDIEMPQMDGLTLCREVRQLSGRQSIPVVFFSSTISEEMREKCQSVGGNAAYSKPEILALTREIDRFFA